MRKSLFLAVAISILGWCMGCASGKSFTERSGSGGGGGTGTSTFQAGNWAFTTSSGINGIIYLGGYLSASGTTVSGNLYVVGDQGSGFLVSKSMTPMAVTGTLNNGTLTLTGAVASSNFTITFTGVSPSGTITSLAGGSYSVTGGADNGDTGSISGAVAGSFTGSWAGTDTTTGGTMTVSMTEATSPTNGAFKLTAASGSGVTFVGGAGCTVTGNLVSTSSFAAGGIVVLDITTTDNGVSGEVIFAGAANNNTAPTAITNSAFYVYTGGSGCLLQNTGNQVSFALTKQ